MEIKICECGSTDVSEDLSTNFITCLRCGKSSKGKLMDTDSLISKYGKMRIPKNINSNPFNIQQKIIINYSKDNQRNKNT